MGEGFTNHIAFNYDKWIEGLETDALAVSLLILKIANNFVDNKKGKKRGIISFIRTKKQIVDFFEQLNVFVVDIYLERLEQFKEKHPIAPPRKSDKPSWGRNEPCPCGSGKKFKKCCGSAV